MPDELNLRRGQAVAVAGKTPLHSTCHILHSALNERSKVRVSAARTRAGSMVRVYSSRNAWRPAEDSGCFLSRMRFTSPTHPKNHCFPAYGINLQQGNPEGVQGRESLGLRSQNGHPRRGGSPHEINLHRARAAAPSGASFSILPSAFSCWRGRGRERWCGCIRCVTPARRRQSASPWKQSAAISSLATMGV